MSLLLRSLSRRTARFMTRGLQCRARLSRARGPAQTRRVRRGGPALATHGIRPITMCAATLGPSSVPLRASGAPLQLGSAPSLSTSAGNAAQDPIVYQDDFIQGILAEVKTIAMVGASLKWNRPSYFAMKYLQEKGYRVIPVNPGAAGKTLLGERVYASLTDIPADAKVDMVDIFQAGSKCPPFTRQAAEIGAGVVWLQLGVRSDECVDICKSNDMKLVMDRCPKIEFSRLFGELSMHGFNSHVISSRRRPVGRPSDGAGEGTRAGLESFNTDNTGFETRCIHAGAAPDPTTGARATPIFQTTSYVFEDVDQAASLFNLQTFGNIYARISNPTTAVLEERLASLDGGRGSTCTASGHSAQLVGLFPLMDPGDRMVASNKLYGGSITQFGKSIHKFAWDCTFVDVDDLDAVRAAVAQDGVKCLWAESLANPGGYVSDIQALADIAHDVGIPLIIDNTLATPYLCRPIEHGADLVVYSTTKFLSGHGNAMGGCVVDSGKFDWAQNDKFPSLSKPEPAYHGLTFQETFGDLAYTTFSHAVSLRDLGPTMAPMNAFLTITGLETLPVRMDRHCENARQVAEFLDAHPAVEWVSYAGLKSSAYNELAGRYLRNGAAGSVFTFGLKGGYDSGVRCVERCQIFSHLANVGDTRSLILHPASTTHRQLTSEQREIAGASDSVIRLSIGLETPEDLIKDLDMALSA